MNMRKSEMGPRQLQVLRAARSLCVRLGRPASMAELAREVSIDGSQLYATIRKLESKVDDADRKVLPQRRRYTRKPATAAPKAGLESALKAELRDLELKIERLETDAWEASARRDKLTTVLAMLEAQ